MPGVVVEVGAVGYVVIVHTDSIWRPQIPSGPEMLNLIDFMYKSIVSTIIMICK